MEELEGQLDFKNMDFEEVLSLAQEDDQEALRYILEKYEGYIHRIIEQKNLFIKNGSREDLVQDGRFGIFKAIQNFDKNAMNRDGSPQEGFEDFLKVCVFRQLVTTIIYSNRKKNQPLNNTISLDQTFSDNEKLSLMDVFSSKNEAQKTMNLDHSDPEKIYMYELMKDSFYELAEEILSEKEKQTLYELIEGKSYKEIQDSLDYKKVKMIDNALQRSRNKFKNHEEDFEYILNYFIN